MFPRDAMSLPISNMKKRPKGLCTRPICCEPWERRSQLRLYHLIPSVSVSALFLASDNRHTESLDCYGCRGERARAIGLSRLSARREGAGGAFDQRVCHRSTPICRISGKEETAADDGA